MDQIDRLKLKRLFATGPMKNPEQSVGFAVWKLSLGYQRRIDASLRDIELTHTQFVILAISAWLNYTQQTVSQGDVARMSGVQKAQVSLTMKSLRSKKLVRQQKSSENPSVRLVWITSAGIRLLSTAIPRIAKVQVQLWPSENELQVLLRTIQKTLSRWEVDAC